MMGGRRVSNAEARKIAAMLEKEFEGLYDRWEIAGSVRRGIETAGDLDLVVIPREGFNEKLGAMFGWQVPKRKADPLKTKKTGLVDEVQVDFNLTTQEAFGAALMFATGSPQVNIVQRQQAKRLGLLLNEKGVWRGETRIAGKTELECYEALELNWMEPRERSI